METEIIFRGIERVIVTLTVPLLIYIGYLLFLKGIKGEMEIAAERHTLKGKFTNVAPGSLCFLLGVTLGAYIMFSKVEILRSDTHSHAGVPKAEQPMDSSKDVIVRFLGGNSGGLPPSTVLLEIYGNFGIKVHDLYTRGRIQNTEIQKLVEEEIRPKVKSSLTYVQFLDLKATEKRAAEANPQALKQIEAYRNEHLLN